MKHHHPKKTESEASRARTRARAAWYCLDAIWVLCENSPEDMAIMKLDQACNDCWTDFSECVFVIVIVEVMVRVDCTVSTIMLGR